MTQPLFAMRANGPLPRRYLALYLPWLAAERQVAARRVPPDAPFVLVEKQRGMLRIAALSPRAAPLGLASGLPLADARGLVPDLAAISHDPAGDRVLLDRLTRLCLDYTPVAAPDPPQGLMLDIAGCAHLHGGEVAMRRSLAARLAEEGYSAQAAIADTPDAARTLARCGGGDVHAIAIAALPIDEEARTALRRAGFRTVGDLAELPPAPLTARFGEGLVRLLDRLMGREDPHIVPHRAVEPVFSEMRFAEPIGRNDDVLEAIEVLAVQAADALGKRGEGARACTVRLHRSDGHVAWLTIETGAPTRDPALLLRLLRERIDSLADPLDPGFGYDSIDLTIARTEPLAEHQPGLERKEKRSGDIGALLDRLAVRHGAARVLRFAAGDSHVPERAGKLRAVAEGGGGALPWERPEAGDPPARPLILFDPPQRVEVLAAVPDGPPRRFRWRGATHLVARVEGPERIAPEWWRRPDGYDGNPGLSRDYYRVETDGGRRLWLFRHGLYERETNHPQWYIHGLFA